MASARLFELNSGSGWILKIGSGSGAGELFFSCCNSRKCIFIELWLNQKCGFCSRLQSMSPLDFKSNEKGCRVVKEEREGGSWWAGANVGIEVENWLQLWQILFLWAPTPANNFSWFRLQKVYFSGLCCSVRIRASTIKIDTIHPRSWMARVLFMI